MKAFHPDRYHGHPGRKNFFEGWYFKLVEPTEQQVFAFIPGIFLGKEPQDSHAFLQVLDGKGLRHLYRKERPEVFQFQAPFQLRVGENRFSLTGLHLSVWEPEISVEGNIDFLDVARWPDSRFSPGSMGWYNFVPGMECYSQVCAMDFGLRGRLAVDGRKIDFTGGRGYIEKNWGRAFPRSWLWIQSNSFSRERVSLSVSLGEIPFWPATFRGFLIGLMVGEQFYRFTTMNHSHLAIRPEGDDVLLEAKNRRYLLRLKTRTERGTFIRCHGPKEGSMIPLVQENLQGRVSLMLQDRRTGEVLFEGEGLATGIEYGGRHLELLQKELELAVP